MGFGLFSCSGNPYGILYHSPELPSHQPGYPEGEDETNPKGVVEAVSSTVEHQFERFDVCGVQVGIDGGGGGRYRVCLDGCMNSLVNTTGQDQEEGDRDG